MRRRGPKYTKSLPTESSSFLVEKREKKMGVGAQCWASACRSGGWGGRSHFLRLRPCSRVMSGDTAQQLGQAGMGAWLAWPRGHGICQFGGKGWM